VALERMGLVKVDGNQCWCATESFVLVVSLLGREKVIQRGAGLVHLPVDERAAHAVPGGQDTDGFSARQSPNGHHLAFVGRLFCGGGANGLIHGDAGLKMGRHYPTACFSPLMCNAALNLVRFRHPPRVGVPSESAVTLSPELHTELLPAPRVWVGNG